MAFNVVLMDKGGNQIEVVEEPVGVPIAQGVKKAGDLGLRLVSTVDPYGDTVFSGVEVEVLRDEWATIVDSAETGAARDTLVKVLALLQRGALERGVVKFVGD